MGKTKRQNYALNFLPNIGRPYHTKTGNRGTNDSLEQANRIGSSGYSVPDIVLYIHMKYVISDTVQLKFKREHVILSQAVKE